MKHYVEKFDYDVVVLGAGSAGVAAAIAAKEQGANVVLIDAGPNLGGELISGLPIDGCLNARGEWIVGGITRALFRRLEAMGGYIGPIFDWRLCWLVSVDPELFKLVVVDAITSLRIPYLLYTFAESVKMDESGNIVGLNVINKGGRKTITARVFIDCSGDADLVAYARGPVEIGGDKGELQPVSLVFRMSDVKFSEYLEFIRDNPAEFILAESPVIKKTPAECAREIYNAGHPAAGLSASGRFLGDAIARGEMYPCTALYSYPTSVQRREMGFNCTRASGVNANSAAELSASLGVLSNQIMTAMKFIKTRIPGFDRAFLSGVAPRVGIRETRRIVAEKTLTTENVANGEKQADGIGKGAHHIDVHGSGKAQLRRPVVDGNSYDIPYGTPRKRLLHRAWRRIR